jgi:hypothetical protein
VQHWLLLTSATESMTRFVWTNIITAINSKLENNHEAEPWKGFVEDWSPEFSRQTGLQFRWHGNRTSVGWITLQSDSTILSCSEPRGYDVTLRDYYIFTCIAQSVRQLWCELNDRGIGVRFLAGDNDCSLLHNVQTGSTALLRFIYNRNGFSSGLKRQRRETDHSPI